MSSHRTRARRRQRSRIRRLKAMSRAQLAPLAVHANRMKESQHPAQPASPPSLRARSSFQPSSHSMEPGISQASLNPHSSAAIRRDSPFVRPPSGTCAYHSCKAGLPVHAEPPHRASTEPTLRQAIPIPHLPVAHSKNDGTCPLEYSRIHSDRQLRPFRPKRYALASRIFRTYAVTSILSKALSHAELPCVQIPLHVVPRSADELERRDPRRCGVRLGGRGAPSGSGTRDTSFEIRSKRGCPRGKDHKVATADAGNIRADTDSDVRLESSRSGETVDGMAYSQVDRHTRRVSQYVQTDATRAQQTLAFDCLPEPLASILAKVEPSEVHAGDFHELGNDLSLQEHKKRLHTIH